MTEVDNVGMAMMVNNAIAAMNFFMTYFPLLCGRSALRFVYHRQVSAIGKLRLPAAQ